MLDINKFKNIQPSNDRYNRRMEVLKGNGFEIQNIEEVVTEAFSNLKDRVRSFVIYGEPQSGKTEMMIAMTAKLLDEGYKIIVILLNDSDQLLEQNLTRFKLSGIDPTPVTFEEILEEQIGERNWIIFCKKNTKNLHKLIPKLERKTKIVVIDDEADYASPNYKVNRRMRSAINKSIYTLLGDDGIYIGVTATPARLDLNNTFENIPEKWIIFKTHGEYVGKDVFFPVVTIGSLDYKLNFLPETGDHPTYLRTALLHLMVDVAVLNSMSDTQGNYCFLIHTSGKKVEHQKDKKVVQGIFDVLSNPEHRDYEKVLTKLHEIATSNSNDPDGITTFILRNINRKTIAVLNSDRIVEIDPTNPPSLFTIVIGGNIVSRGVTFERLLGMFFTRDAKHKMQQDTYIQRARMFGNRKKYIQHFQLWIPAKLYVDWQTCFIYHYLSLESLRRNNISAPVWIATSRIKPVAESSVDKRTVFVDTGEMPFELTEWKDDILEIVHDKQKDPMMKLEALHDMMGDDWLPKYILNFVKNYSRNGSFDIAIHEVRNVRPESDYHDKLYRERGILAGKDIKNHPYAIHHFLIVRNTKGLCRIVYRYTGNVQFFKNLARKTSA